MVWTRFCGGIFYFDVRCSERLFNKYLEESETRGKNKQE